MTGDLPVDVRVADARSSGLEPGYDRILLDAPCSGLGSLRRRPRPAGAHPDDVTELVVLQTELLTEALRLVKPGGVVIYSTCSPHPPKPSTSSARWCRRCRMPGNSTPVHWSLSASSTVRCSAPARTFSCGRTCTVPTPCSWPRSPGRIVVPSGDTRIALGCLASRTPPSLFRPKGPVR